MKQFKVKLVPIDGDGSIDSVTATIKADDRAAAQDQAVEFMNQFGETKYRLHDDERVKV